MRGERSKTGRAGFVCTAAFAVAMLCVIASASHAAEDYARTGWYAGLSGSYASQRGTVENKTDTSLGFALTGGFRLHERVAVEGEFEWLDGFNTGSFGIDAPILITANTKGYLLTGNFQPWALFGLGTMTLFDNTTPTEVTRLGFILRFGLGADLYLTPKIALTVGLNYVKPIGRMEEYRFLTFNFGTTYRF